MSTVTANKVKYGLKNVHYAVATIASDGSATYSTPVAIPGAVNLSLSASGDTTKFYADGYAYYTVSNNNGYEGDLEIAVIPESFRKDILGETLDAKKVLIENAGVQPVHFALLFEFDGDAKNTRHCLFNCVAGRPQISSKTNEESIEVQTETISITASPLKSGKVKASTTEATESTDYEAFMTAVYS